MVARLDYHDPAGAVAAGIAADSLLELCLLQVLRWDLAAAAAYLAAAPLAAAIA